MSEASVELVPTRVPSGDRARHLQRRQVDKFSAKRAELAEAALLTLAELGYARTSLREIAQNSPYSHGVLHYYFADKVDLITECVRQYKAECVQRYDQIVADSRTAAQLRVAFGRRIAATMVDDAPLHRLWYDMRSQSMFEPKFRADVLAIGASLEAMIWRIVSRYAELSEIELRVSPAYAYGVFDGLFQHALLNYLNGDAGAAKRLRRQAGQVLDQLLSAA